MSDGLCECGCGQKTWVPTYSSKTIGVTKGVPVRFVTGHHRRITKPIEKAEPFKIDGVYCRLLPLTRGLHAIVDASDYEWLMKWNWHAVKDHGNPNYYAYRTAFQEDGGHHIPLHRLLLDLDPGDGRVGDHINGNTLDNRRANLRVADFSQNQWNKKKGRNNSSGHKGVRYEADRNQWKVAIGFKGVQRTIGRFASLQEAIEARRKAEESLHQEYARRNS